jgi:hypothetical protein
MRKGRIQIVEASNSPLYLVSEQEQDYMVIIEHTGSKESVKE